MLALTGRQNSPLLSLLSIAVNHFLSAILYGCLRPPTLSNALQCYSQPLFCVHSSLNNTLHRSPMLFSVIHSLPVAPITLSTTLSTAHLPSPYFSTTLYHFPSTASPSMHHHLSAPFCTTLHRYPMTSIPLYCSPPNNLNSSPSRNTTLYYSSSTASIHCHTSAPHSTTALSLHRLSIHSHL